MIVNITPLGGTAGQQAAGSISGIVEYLEGGVETLTKTHPGQQTIAQHHSGVDNGSLVGRGDYYIDSGTGTWFGEGTGGMGYELAGSVDKIHLERLLAGCHPHTGEKLMHSVGSTARKSNKKGPLPKNKGTVMLTDIANHLDIAPTYLRRVARETATIEQSRRDAAELGNPLPSFPETYLNATKVGNQWTVSAEEAERFVQARKEPRAVYGYDITWSVPKSISVLAANSTPEVRAEINKAIQASVESGMSFLEREALWVRNKRDHSSAGGMVSALYHHSTSRAGEPQEHIHAATINMVTNSKTGEIKAIDARGLYAYGTTAGHLAAAELRKELTERLGVHFKSVEGGAPEIDGVPESAIREMSSRSKEIADEVRHSGNSSVKGRTKAALDTRKPKTDGLNIDELRQDWQQRLALKGFTREDAQATMGRSKVIRRSEKMILTSLSSAQGVTERKAIFDRRDVLMKAAEVAGPHYGIREIENLADRWIRSKAVRLDIVNDWETIGSVRGGGKVKLSHEQLYSTSVMMDLEQRVLALHKNGHDANSSRVPPSSVEKHIADFEDRNGFELGADQARTVRAITTSGHQFQAVQGLAGSGKTTALSPAVNAWQHEGFEVLAVAPYGTAVRKLAGDLEADIETRTLESLLTKAELADHPGKVLKPEMVVIVDEASTMSTRQTHRLYKLCNQTGTTVRTIGDPKQHKSVEAGGLWGAIVEANPDSTQILDENRRQSRKKMSRVRASLTEYRKDNISKAIKILEDDNRIETAASWNEMLEDITRQWEPYFLKEIDSSSPPQIITERHRDRVELNELAQRRLREAGVLTTPVDIGPSTFHKGDLVVAQRSSRKLFPKRGAPKSSVINGSLGRIVGFRGERSKPDLVVKFNGVGKVRVPYSFVAESVGKGRGGGLEPGYAITSHKAQGQTWSVAFLVTAPGSANKEGTYVGMTRGKEKLLIGSIDPNDTPERLEAEFSPPPIEKGMVQQLIDSVTRPTAPDVASVASPASLKRHREEIEQDLKNSAVLAPNPETVDLIGQRPTIRGPMQTSWEAAAETLVIDRYHSPDPLRPLSESSVAAINVYKIEREAVRPLGDLIDQQRHRQQRQGRTPNTPSLQDQAVDLLIERAVESPSRYLTDVIGPRPDENPEEWVTAARTIERYRHQNKLTPGHGRQLGSSPLARAVGKQGAKDSRIKTLTTKLTEKQSELHRNL